jgi:hypothetical protein
VKLKAAVTKTIKVIVKVIANTSLVAVRFNGDSPSHSNQTFLNCWATMREKEYGRALELLNAKMRDKTFALSVSNALGIPVTMEETDWSEFGITELDLNDFKKSEEPLSLGKTNHCHLISFHYFYLTPSSVLYSRSFWCLLVSLFLQSS